MFVDIIGTFYLFRVSNELYNVIVILDTKIG